MGDERDYELETLQLLQEQVEVIKMQLQLLLAKIEMKRNNP